MGRHELYDIWAAMRQRCVNPNNKRWARYGGRGISVCSRWDSFELFLRDMGPRPPGMTIERIDNDGDYCPENVRWASVSEQNQNKSNVRLLELDGRVMTLSQWAKELGMKPPGLHARLRRLSVREALTAKNRYWKHRQITSFTDEPDGTEAFEPTREPGEDDE